MKKHKSKIIRYPDVSINSAWDDNPQDSPTTLSKTTVSALSSIGNILLLLFFILIAYAVIATLISNLGCYFSDNYAKCMAGYKGYGFN